YLCQIAALEAVSNRPRIQESWTPRQPPHFCLTHPVVRQPGAMTDKVVAALPTKEPPAWKQELHEVGSWCVLLEKVTRPTPAEPKILRNIQLCVTAVTKSTTCSSNQHLEYLNEYRSALIEALAFRDLKNSNTACMIAWVAGLSASALFTFTPNSASPEKGDTVTLENLE
ncbi:hypothetical protein CABS01_15559, partial [Colletotrichum abscissum]